MTPKDTKIKNTDGGYLCGPHFLHFLNFFLVIFILTGTKRILKENKFSCFVFGKVVNRVRGVCPTRRRSNTPCVRMWEEAELPERGGESERRRLS